MTKLLCILFYSFFLLDIGQFVTSITLDHTLYTGLTQPPLKPQIASTTTQPEIPQTSIITRRPVIHTTLSTTNDDIFGVTNNEFECGTTDYKAPTTTGLIIGGNQANRGQFPW